MIILSSKHNNAKHWDSYYTQSLHSAWEQALVLSPLINEGTDA